MSTESVVQVNIDSAKNAKINNCFAESACNKGLAFLRHGKQGGEQWWGGWGGEGRGGEGGGGGGGGGGGAKGARRREEGKGQKQVPLFVHSHV